MAEDLLDRDFPVLIEGETAFVPSRTCPGMVCGRDLHDGVAVRVFVDPDNQDRAILTILGGHAAIPGFEDDGVVARINAAGLRRLGADLISAGLALEWSRPFQSG